MKTFAMYSLGCKVNSYESNAIARSFEVNDYMQVDFKDKADVYIINTCTVTNTGDAKSRKIIRQAIKRNPDAIVVAFGCYAQVSPDEVIAIDGVDIVLGTQYRDKIVDYVNNHDKSKQLKLVDNIFEQKQFEDMHLQTHITNKRAYLKIQEGCNMFCTYCIIPYARGLMRSRSRDSIINEAQELVKKGYNEIVLTGIHTGGYGSDLQDYSFNDLLRDILNEVPDLKRLRISSIEINQINEETLEIMKNDRIAKHLHIPIQAGSNDILKLMNRRYNIDQYVSKIEQIRNVLGDVAITTDIILGFPNEDDDMFKETLETIDKVNFFDMHVFPYSARKGTPAAKMDNQVNEQVKSNRVAQALKINFEHNKTYIDKFVGKDLDIIVEGHDVDDFYYGHSSNYIKVYFEKKDSDFELGDMVKVKLVENINYPKGEILYENA